MARGSGSTIAAGLLGPPTSKGTMFLTQHCGLADRNLLTWAPSEGRASTAPWLGRSKAITASSWESQTRMRISRQPTIFLATPSMPQDLQLEKFATAFGGRTG